nr:hypothetical protein [Tanacetum cinerariifolium]
MMSFLTAVVTSWYPTTNNQLRNSLNPRQQATINNERVTLQPIQGRQTTFATGTSRTYTSGASGNNFGKQRTIICYNCKGEGQMSKQCTKPKRKQDDSWFKDKVLLKTNDIVIRDFEETLMLAEESRSKMLLIQKDPMMSEKNTELSAEQVFCSQNYVNSKEPNLSTRPTQVEVPKELPKVIKNMIPKVSKCFLNSFSLTMDIIIDQQVALDEALVPHASRLRIGKGNFCLRSDITSKESTLQVVYDVLILTQFYKAFLVTADVPEIYMQEFWATATIH